MVTRHPLPPLQPVPTLERLLAPGEVILYTAKLHPLYGAPLALLALACALAAWWQPVAALGSLFFLTLYLVPLRKNEIAVTSKRLLLRIGRFKLLTETVSGDQLINWRVAQSAVDNLLHVGTVQLTFSELGQTRQLVLTHLWHPVSFIEALETLQPHLRGQIASGPSSGLASGPGKTGPGK